MTLIEIFLSQTKKIAEVKMNKKLLLLLVVPLLLSSYGCSKKTFTYQNIVIEHEITPDPEVEAMVSTYRRQLEAEMNQIIGFLEHEMPKGRPGQTLMGNFICDLLLDAVNRSVDTQADLAILNFGGLRLNSLPYGNITVGHIYELLPFENYVVVLDIEGKVMEEWIHNIASSGGWPVSKNIELKLKKEGDNTVVENVTIHNQPLNHDKIYKVVTVDYVANGGDKAKLLVDLPRYNTEVLMRDMILHEIEAKVKKGEKLKSELDNRIKF